MNGLRFKVGDVARLVVGCSKYLPYIGSVVEIVVVGPFQALAPIVVPTLHHHKVTTEKQIDYVVRVCDGKHGGCMDWQLAPIDGSPDPKAVIRESEKPVAA